jgi:hypothetical protein
VNGYGRLLSLCLTEVSQMNDWLTLAAIVLGPISAVLITLVYESWRRQRERRLVIVRMLLTTRHMPADAQYVAAINLIPAEFNKHPRVMQAWRKYQERVNTPAPETEPARAAHIKLIDVSQGALIFQIMQSAGLKALSEGDIQTSAYVSKGFVDRDNLYLDMLAALPEMAATMKTQAALTQRIVDALPNRPQPPTPPIVRDP